MPRLSPEASATSVVEGTIEKGNDDKPWVAIKASNDVQRWTPYISTRLNGFRVLSLDYLTKNIGKEITIYDRPMSSKWPFGIRERGMESYTFIPNGDAIPINRKKPWKDWLVTRSPSSPKQGYLMIEGVRTSSRESDMDRYWGPMVTGGEAASSNPRNTQSFVRA